MMLSRDILPDILWTVYWALCHFYGFLWVLYELLLKFYRSLYGVLAVCLEAARAQLWNTMGQF
jgi:hypothetical protein